MNAFPNENTFLQFRQPNMIGPKSRANITPVNQLTCITNTCKDLVSCLYEGNYDTNRSIEPQPYDTHVSLSSL